MKSNDCRSICQNATLKNFSGNYQRCIDRSNTDQIHIDYLSIIFHIQDATYLSAVLE